MTVSMIIGFKICLDFIKIPPRILRYKNILWYRILPFNYIDGIVSLVVVIFGKDLFDFDFYL